MAGRFFPQRLDTLDGGFDGGLRPCEVMDAAADGR